MKMTINVEENNGIKQDKEKKIESKYKHKEKGLSINKKSKKILNKNQNSGVFRNNYKNYQYDYEADFYEPY